MRLPSDVPNEGCGERPPLIPPSDVPLFPAFQMQHHPDDAGDQADDDAYGETLDAFINTEQQSYDEFLQNFVHLTAHDVPSASSLYNDSDFGEDLPNPVIPAQPGNHQLFTIEDIYIPPLLGNSEEATYILPPPVTGPEHLEEEILGEGSRAPDILIRSTDSGIVRVDNFVEIEDEDDDLGIGSYQASFGSPQKTEEQPNEEAISKVCDNNKADVSPEEDTDGIDTDPVQKSVRKIKHEILEGTDTNENNANNEKLKIEEQTEKEKVRQNEELRLDRERILSIKSSSNEKELTSKESDNLLDLVMENSESDTESDLEYDPALDKPNFGEVDDEQPVVAEKDVENIRNLDFSAKFGVPNNIRPAVIDTNETEKQKVQEEVKATGEEEPVIIDNVEPFKLDDDFDYDNVILTPKFTAEEVRYLNSFLPSNQGAGSAK